MLKRDIHRKSWWSRQVTHSKVCGVVSETHVIIFSQMDETSTLKFVRWLFFCRFWMMWGFHFKKHLGLMVWWWPPPNSKVQKRGQTLGNSAIFLVMVSLYDLTSKVQCPSSIWFFFALWILVNYSFPEAISSNLNELGSLAWVTYRLSFTEVGGICFVCPIS